MHPRTQEAFVDDRLATPPPSTQDGNESRICLCKLTPSGDGERGEVAGGMARQPFVVPTTSATAMHCACLHEAWSMLLVTWCMVHGAWRMLLGALVLGACCALACSTDPCSMLHLAGCRLQAAGCMLRIPPTPPPPPSGTAMHQAPRQLNSKWTAGRLGSTARSRPFSSR